ncbi:MAG: hypothetical protein E5X66_15485 [Mesorhizobium sp.]|nr:MAG: hypothetical protein E5X66_15485 [Mesorhizobium sp.]
MAGSIPGSHVAQQSDRIQLAAICASFARTDARVRKRYHPPATPCHRLVGNPQPPGAVTPLSASLNEGWKKFTNSFVRLAVQKPQQIDLSTCAKRRS